MNRRLDEKVPGITFFLTRVTQKVSAYDARKQLEVTMQGFLDNDGIWESVQETLKRGLRIYSQNDFQEEMISVLRNEVHQLESKTAELKYELAQQQKENVFLREELQKKKDILYAFTRQVGK